MKRRTKVGDIVRLNRNYDLNTMIKVLFSLKDITPGNPHVELVKRLVTVTGKVTKEKSEYKGKFKWWRSVAFEKYGQLWVPPKFLVHALPITSGTWVRISPRYRPSSVAKDLCYAEINMDAERKRNRLYDATGLTKLIGRVSTTYSNDQWARVNFQTHYGEVWIPVRFLIAVDQPTDPKVWFLEFEEEPADPKVRVLEFEEI